MKLSYISLAVAAAFAVGDAAANQVYVEQSGQSIWASGASAPTRAVYNAFASNCTTAGNTVYMSGTSSAITSASRPGDSGTGNFFMYRCTIDGTKTATFSTWDGQFVNMYHTVDGGSFVAFEPHLPIAVPTKRITPALTGCTLVGTSGGVTVYKSCGTTVADNAHRPDGGFADVEDDLWPTLNQNTNFVHKSANVTQAFGVAVTDELYKALQAAQIADGFLNASCVIGDFTPSSGATGCQPAISPDIYRSIISSTAAGAYHQDWNRVLEYAANPTAGSGQVVRVCRRVDTSGTQASSNTYFLENPCRQWNKQIGQLLPSTSASAEAEVIDNGFFYDVVENSGTGDVKACLTNSNNLVSKSGSINGVAGDYVSDATTTFAIGVMSMENIVGSSDRFKFVRLGHVSPNFDAKQRTAAAQGWYPFVMEMAYWGVGTSGVGSGSKPFTLNPVVNTEPFFTELAKDMSSPTILDLAGLFISPASGATPNGDDVGYGSKGGKNCGPQELF